MSSATDDPTSSRPAPPASPPDGSAGKAAVRPELFGPGRRATTVGIVLLISMIAFEAMGVGTAMPAVVADLGSVSSYAWPFVAFTAASVVGTVLGGRWCDVRGPRGTLVTAPLLFGAGLLVAGTAGTLAQLLVARVLQGLGAGAVAVAVYVLIALVYSERARPAVFALMSSAWVLPALVGPPVAGVVTEQLSWHWVFLGIVPFVVVAVVLVLPAVRDLPAGSAGAPATRRGIVAAALAAAAAVAALSWAGQHPTGWAALVVAVVALALLVPSLRRLLPRGTVRARRGIAAVVACRGLLSGAFFTVNAYLPLMLTSTHGWSLSMAGVPLIVGALGWSSAAAWQGRHPDLSRPVLLRVGFACVAVGIAGLLLVAPAWGLPWLALPFWIVAGVGMGLGFSSLSFLLLARSADSGAGAVGFDSAAAQLTDQLSQAALVGVGGALLATTGSPATALPVLVAGLVVLAVTGTGIAGRTAGPARAAAGR
ncbi:MFS transporter [Pseudonocardia dioxanivorans]|uniref:Major facilitator superfamily MFS_1 n=1 Tax=Pseudonocardia dioxanivorans (strain ATCC 55486 / DSM 44775 / JCM 13855 / CB1190) TaxID=675635 RepID=F4CRE4_PSEUX|nr:MFS transporter [Pseudonocardia dioxanivorans]AEA25235.1 major facilitator superfamily MFS_1 [Pseudonocardia dioxanivorans CB1190]